MVESPVVQNTNMERILAFYVRWCSIIQKEHFLLHSAPNTASIAWLTLVEGQGPRAVYSTHQDIFSVSCSLPGANPLKLKAARKRHEFLMRVLAPRILPPAPRFGKLQSEGSLCFVDWGHCAETLAVLWSVWYHMRPLLN
jgi:hypothetical protein